MINKYKLMLNNDRHPYLVKEASLEYPGEAFTSPDMIVDMLNDCFNLDIAAEEYMYMVVLNSAGHSCGVFEISHGTANASLVSVREIFIRIFLCGGISFVLAHNHPSGETEPSQEDKNVYRNVKRASDIMGLSMLDFLIIGQEQYLSFECGGL